MARADEEEEAAAAAAERRAQDDDGMKICAHEFEPQGGGGRPDGTGV